MILDFKKRISENEIDIEIDKYLEPKHHLMGNQLSMQILEEKPNISFEISTEKKKKSTEVIEIEYVRKSKHKSEKLF